MSMKYFNPETKEVKSEWEIMSMFDEAINDAFGVVDVAGYKYSTAEVLRAVDPNVYNGFIGDMLDDAGWVDYPTWLENVHKCAEKEYNGDFYNWNEEFGGKLLDPVEVCELSDMTIEEVMECYMWERDVAEMATRWAKERVANVEAARQDIDSLLERILETTSWKEIVAMVEKIGEIEKNFGDDPLAQKLRKALRE